MATQHPPSPSDVELLHAFLGRQLEAGDKQMSLESAMAEFAEYHRQLTELRAKVDEAQGSLSRGKAAPLDLESILDRVRGRLNQQGGTS